MSAQVRKQSGNGGFIAALVAIVLAGGGFIWWKTQQKAEVAGPVVMPTAVDSVTALKAKGYSMGALDAKIEIVEFADFECPACGSYASITEPDVRKNLVETGKVRYTYYDFPLTNAHQNTLTASMAAACAADEGKFWEMHDMLFQGQYDWNGQATKTPRDVIAKYAQTIGLDMKKWNTCMDTNAHMDRIKANYALGMTYKVGSTPTFLINGSKLEGAANYDDINAAVNAAMAANLPIPTSGDLPKGDTAAAAAVPAVPAKR